METKEEWYLLYTKPHKEKLVTQSLEARGIESYLPLVRARGRHGVWGLRPFFPCYLFAHVDLDAVGLSTVKWTPGLRKLVAFGDDAKPVPAAVVDHIRERLADLKEQGIPKFAAGQRGVIKQGPLRELEAIFDRELSASDRATVLIEILGRLTRSEVDTSWLEAR